MKGTALFILCIFGATCAAQAAAPTRSTQTSKTVAKKKPVRKRTLKTPVFDPTIGDAIDGDDLVVRRAAVEALGSQNGSVVVTDPGNGRVLTIVNQKLAYDSGFIPCSTIKLVTSLAALTEQVIDRDTVLKLGRYMRFDMTTALAHSNNQYFSELGKRLGYERVVHYARMMGLGEKAGLDIDGERPGSIAPEAPRAGGMGLMTAFGEGFLMTPLELAGILSSIQNNGTLYYLQYPRNQTEIDNFAPRVKRTLEVAPNGISDIKMGMRGAVDYGTARRANYDPTESIFGKTGTCTDFRAGSHMGWFGSFIQSGVRPLVVVVMLTSPVKSVSGPAASGVAGAFYHNLAEQHYFAMAAAPSNRNTGLPEILSCCTRQDAAAAAAKSATDHR
jgi:cell division protein FtsI/penicillin-binding protein 2